MEVVRVLIEAGADVNALDSDRDSPLHLAAEMNPEIVPVLLEAGATVNLLDNNQHSPLLYAAFSDHDSAVDALIAAGADPQIGISPLTSSDIGEDMKAYMRSLFDVKRQGREFLFTLQPEFNFTYTFYNCSILHKLLITGQGEQVLSRRGELNRDLLSTTCEIKDMSAKVRCRVELMVRVRTIFFTVYLNFGGEQFIARMNWPHLILLISAVQGLMAE